MAQTFEDALRGDIINHSEAEDYVQPKEQAVRDKLEWFRDQKLGFMVHWGIYSQLGITESWPLSEEDAVWSRKGYTWEKDPTLFREQYVNMNRSFNPLRFEPDAWADFAKQAEFRYFIFTTKHHDGFCMYDTKLTDYKITSADCPFHTHRYANIAKELFDAFRRKGIGIAPYFSKPDWHCPWYWAPGQDLPVAHWRNPTYDPHQKPELWEQFIRYTHGQLMELVRDLGPVDILWLDGGQVNARQHQDIRLMEFAHEARKLNPGLILADRTVGGETENYITPEQQIPDHYIPVPWESCMTAGHSFAFNYEDEYKSPRRLTHLFTDVVGKGGNLALNLGAQPDGRLPVRGMKPVLAFGAWVRENAEAIFSTRALEPYFDGPWSFTQNQENRFAIKRLEEGEAIGEKLYVPLPGIRSAALIGHSDATLEIQGDGQGAYITIPEALRSENPYALCLKLNRA